MPVKLLVAALCLCVLYVTSNSKKIQQKKRSDLLTSISRWQWQIAIPNPFWKKSIFLLFMWQRAPWSTSGTLGHTWAHMGLPRIREAPPPLLLLFVNFFHCGIFCGFGGASFPSLFSCQAVVQKRCVTPSAHLHHLQHLHLHLHLHHLHHLHHHHLQS